MHYFFIIAVLFALILIYFKIASYYNIIDKPNHRSSHNEIAVNGGGIIFPIVYILFMWSKGNANDDSYLMRNYLEGNFWIFGAGLLIICIISFIDDVIDLSTKIRFVFQVIAVSLLLYFLNVFQLFPWWMVPILYILIIGILNAYNFMDGINGISGLYSLVVLVSLLYVNQDIISFIAQDFIIYPILACLVFLYFNLRKKAKCFMGDIGSMGIAFWVIALVGLLMLKTGELKWILFLTVYGVDTILTIIERLKLKENIFDAHRRHLYQLFANDKKVDHRTVSFVYAVIQLSINIFVIITNMPDWLIFFVILLPSVVFYLSVKIRVKKQLSITK